MDADLYGRMRLTARQLLDKFHHLRWIPEHCAQSVSRTRRRRGSWRENPQLGADLSRFRRGKNAKKVIRERAEIYEEEEPSQD
jgi:hypothetical protein